jgi:hypothetical protein
MPYLTTWDVLVGGGIKGQFEHFFLELDGGYFMRFMNQSGATSTGSGFGGALLVGARFGRWRFTLPIHVRRMSSGLSPRWIIETMPYIGVEFAI